MANVVKGEQLYEGKAKKVYATNDPDLVIVGVTRFSFLLIFLLLDWMCSFRLYDTIFVLPAPKNAA